MPPDQSKRTPYVNSSHMVILPHKRSRLFITQTNHDLPTSSALDVDVGRVMLTRG